MEERACRETDSRGKAFENKGGQGTFCALTGQGNSRMQPITDMKLASSMACGALALLVSLQTGFAGHRFAAGDSSKKILAIVDADGKIEWSHPVQAIHDLHVLANGNILFQENFQNVIEMTPTKRVVWKYQAKAVKDRKKRTEIHAFQRLENGLTLIAESGPGRIIEVDGDGKIKKEIKLQIDNPNPHRDTRLVRKLANGHYLVAHEGDGKVREYDGDGKVVWSYDVPMFGRKAAGGHGPEGFGNSLFSALRLPNGNTLIGTGNGHGILEVTPEKKIVWELHQKDLPGITLAWVTQIAALPNGNILIGNCHAGPQNPQLIEVTREKKVVWTFRDFENFGDSFVNNQLLDVKGDVIR